MVDILTLYRILIERIQHLSSTALLGDIGRLYIMRNLFIFILQIKVYRVCVINGSAET